MRLAEILIVIAAMLLPFFTLRVENLATFVYWNAVAAVYLIYIAVRRWEVE